jgi:hypothetical protein
MNFNNETFMHATHPVLKIMPELRIYEDSDKSPTLLIEGMTEFDAYPSATQREGHGNSSALFRTNAQSASRKDRGV